MPAARGPRCAAGEDAGLGATEKLDGLRCRVDLAGLGAARIDGSLSAGVRSCRMRRI